MEMKKEESIYGNHLPELEAVRQQLVDRVQAIREEMAGERGFDPVDHCLSRIKTEESMREKCRRKGLPETTESALEKLYDAVGYEVQFAELMSSLTENQKRVLSAIANEARVRNVNTSAFINRYQLSTASVVNAAIRKLLKEDIITVDLKEYSIPDKFLWLWVNRQYNNA